MVEIENAHDESCTSPTYSAVCMQRLLSVVFPRKVAVCSARASEANARARSRVHIHVHSRASGLFFFFFFFFFFFHVSHFFTLAFGVAILGFHGDLPRLGVRSRKFYDSLRCTSA